MNKSFKYLFFVYFSLLCNICFSAPIQVCSAENFYGNIAVLIGGKHVKVTNIISNPNSDPHLFCTSPKIAIAITTAQIVIYNGVDYDPWIIQFMESQPCKNKLVVINVAEVTGIQGNNPHIWYNPHTFSVLAKILAEKFSALQPDNKAYFESNLTSFNTRYKEVFNLIDNIKSKHSGTSVIATEPVFGYMADALGFDMKGKEFQWVIMNGSDPSPKMTADFIEQIKNKKVKILFYNNQVTSSTTEYIQSLAKQNNIQIVGISETMPDNNNVIEWFSNELKEILKALNNSKNPKAKNN